MAAVIKIDQLGSGIPAGVDGIAREDLLLGFAAQLSSVGPPALSYQWLLIDKAIDMSAGVQSAAILSDPALPTTDLAPIDVAGTYLVRLSVDSGNGLGAGPDDVAELSFYAGPSLNPDPAELPRREMAFRETLHHNVPDAIFPLGNVRGWAEERQRWQETLLRMYRGKTWAWGKFTSPGGVPSILTSFNVAGIVRISEGVYDILWDRQLPVVPMVKAAVRGAPGLVYVDSEGVASVRVYRADPWGMLVDGDFVLVAKDAYP